MTQPPSFEVSNKSLCKLNKSLYENDYGLTEYKLLDLLTVHVIPPFLFTERVLGCILSGLCS